MTTYVQSGNQVWRDGVLQRSPLQCRKCGGERTVGLTPEGHQLVCPCCDRNRKYKWESPCPHR